MLGTATTCITPSFLSAYTSVFTGRGIEFFPKLWDHDEYNDRINGLRHAVSFKKNFSSPEHFGLQCHLLKVQATCTFLLRAYPFLSMYVPIPCNDSICVTVDDMRGNFGDEFGVNLKNPWKRFTSVGAICSFIILLLDIREDIFEQHAALDPYYAAITLLLNETAVCTRAQVYMHDHTE